MFAFHFCLCYFCKNCNQIHLHFTKPISYCFSYTICSQYTNSVNFILLCESSRIYIVLICSIRFGVNLNRGFSFNSLCICLHIRISILFAWRCNIILVRLFAICFISIFFFFGHLQWTPMMRFFLRQTKRKREEKNNRNISWINCNNLTKMRLNVSQKRGKRNSNQLKWNWRRLRQRLKPMKNVHFFTTKVDEKKNSIKFKWIAWN